MKKLFKLMLTFAMMFTMPLAVFASGADVSVVDVLAPTNEVKLVSGASSPIVITISVTGNQVGTATFEVYRVWTLTNGVFVGSSPKEYTVDARAAGDTPDVFTTSGEVIVDSGVAAGTYPLTVGVFDITNTNSTGAKLGAGTSGTYTVIVEEPVVVDEDTVKPVVTFDVNAPKRYVLNSDASVAWTAYDPEPGSGLKTAASGTLALDTSVVGQFSKCVIAEDNAGNTKEECFAYSVEYVFEGVYQPINADGSSIFKLKSTIPVKFTLKDANGLVVSTAVASISVRKIDSTVDFGVVEAISTSAATEGNLFRFDELNQQYIFNLGTKNLSIVTWELKISLDDGTSQTVRFNLK